MKKLAPAGLTIMLLALAGFSSLAATTSYGMVVALHAGFMFGVSMVMPVMTNGLNQLPARLYSHGTAIVNTVQQVSAAFGTALLVTVMANGTESYLSRAGSGAGRALAVSAVLACVGLLLSLFMKRVATESAQG